MNKQQIFDKVVKHLAKQKQRANNGSCVYRHETGNKKKVLKCAVGCLIPKKLYNKDMEGRYINDMVKKFELPEYFEKESYFLRSLQNIHDNSFLNTESIKVELRKLADNWQLNADCVELITEWKV